MRGLREFALDIKLPLRLVALSGAIAAFGSGVACNPASQSGSDFIDSIVAGDSDVNVDADGDGVPDATSGDGGVGPMPPDAPLVDGSGDDGASGGSGSGDGGGVTPPPPPPGEGEQIQFSTLDVEALIATARASWSLTSFGYYVAGEIVIPDGFHRVRQPIDLKNVDGLTIRGQSANTVLVADFVNPTAPIIDLTGSRHVHIADLGIRGTGQGVGLLLARQPSNDSAGLHLFDNVYVHGSFTRAVVLNAASEVNVWNACTFTSDTAVPALILSNGSPWSDYVVGFSTMQVADFDGCRFFNTSVDPNASIINIVNSAGVILSDIAFNGGYLSITDGSNAQAMKIKVDGQCQQITIRDMRWETNTARKGIFIDTAGNMNGLHIEGGTIHQLEEFVYCPGGMLVSCTLRDTFVFSYATQNWGYGGIRPYVYCRYPVNTSPNFIAIMSPPTQGVPYPANQVMHYWGP